MKVKPMNKYVKLILSPILGDFSAISLCPLGIYIEKYDKYIVNHERIHWRQQIEMLILPFYMWYLTELFIKRIYMNKRDAYLSLSFEKEAFKNQNNLDYLNKRKPYSWFKHF